MVGKRKKTQNIIPAAIIPLLIFKYILFVAVKQLKNVSKVTIPGFWKHLKCLYYIQNKWK